MNTPSKICSKCQIKKMHINFLEFLKIHEWSVPGLKIFLFGFSHSFEFLEGSANSKIKP